jgi:hypothetical protein
MTATILTRAKSKDQGGGFEAWLEGMPSGVGATEALASAAVVAELATFVQGFGPTTSDTSASANLSAATLDATSDSLLTAAALVVAAPHSGEPIDVRAKMAVRLARAIAAELAVPTTAVPGAPPQDTDLVAAHATIASLEAQIVALTHTPPPPVTASVNPVLPPATPAPVVVDDAEKPKLPTSARRSSV